MSRFFISTTSFTSCALSDKIGLTVVASVMARRRAYSSKGSSTSEVAVILVVRSITFVLGTILLGGFVRIIAPEVERHFDLPL